MSMQALQVNFTFQGQKYKGSQKVGVINKGGNRSKKTKQRYKNTEKAGTKACWVAPWTAIDKWPRADYSEPECKINNQKWLQMSINCS